MAMLAMVLFISPSALAQGKEAPESMQGHVKVGDKAPGFTLKDQNGIEHSLDGLLNPDGYLALVFYRSADW
jgi:hypothetical protein